MFFLIARQAKSSDPATRARAAEKLGSGGRLHGGAALPRPVALLLELIADPDAGVRAAAYAALGRVADGAAVETMVRGLADLDKLGDAAAATVREAAATALQAIGEPAVPALLAMAKDKNARLRETAILALAGMDGDKPQAALVAALQDNRSTIRQAAIHGLARNAASGNLDALAAALAHRDPATRKTAIEAVANVSSAEAAGALIRLTRDPDRTVREAAVRALGRQSSAEAVDALLVVFEGSDRELRGLAADALKHLEWQPATPAQRAFRAILRGEYDAAASEGAEAVEPLAALLLEKAAATRAAAVAALGRTGDERAVRPLLLALQDSEASVRQAAGDALVHLGAPAVPAIAESVHEAVQSAAPSIVARIGPAAASPLLDLLEQGEPYHAEGDGGTPPRLVTRVSDETEAERAQRAAALLGRLLSGGQVAVDGPARARLARVRDVVRVREVMPANRREMPTTVVDTVVDCAPLREKARA